MQRRLLWLWSFLLLALFAMPAIAEPTPPPPATTPSATTQPSQPAAKWTPHGALYLPNAASLLQTLHQMRKHGLWAKRETPFLKEARQSLQKHIREQYQETPKENLEGLLQQTGLRLAQPMSMSLWHYTRQGSTKAQIVVIMSFSAEAKRIQKSIRQGKLQWTPEDQEDQLGMETHFDQQWLYGMRFGDRFYLFLRDDAEFEKMTQKGAERPDPSTFARLVEQERAFLKDAYTHLQSHTDIAMAALRAESAHSKLTLDPSVLLWAGGGFEGFPPTKDLIQAHRFVRGVALSLQRQGEQVKAKMEIQIKPSVAPFLSFTQPKEAPRPLAQDLPANLLALQSLHLDLPALGQIPSALTQIGLLPRNVLFSLYLGYGGVDSIAQQSGFRLHEIWEPLNGQLSLGVLADEATRQRLYSQNPALALEKSFLLVGFKKGRDAQAWLTRFLNLWPSIHAKYGEGLRGLSLEKETLGKYTVAVIKRHGIRLLTLYGAGERLVISPSPTTLSKVALAWEDPRQSLAQSNDPLKKALAHAAPHFAWFNPHSLFSPLPPLDAVKALFLRGVRTDAMDYLIKLAFKTEGLLFNLRTDQKYILTSATTTLVTPSPQDLVTYQTLRKLNKDIIHENRPKLPAEKKPLALPPPPPVIKELPATPPARLEKKPESAPSTPTQERPATPPQRSTPSQSQPPRGDAFGLVEPAETHHASACNKLPPLLRQGAPTLGSPNAPVTIVMFYSLQCPFSKRAHSNILQLLKEYPKKIRLVFRHRPLPFHKMADFAAQAAMAAHAQGKFWEFVEKIFAMQQNITADKLFEEAKNLGLNLEALDKALKDENLKRYIDEDNKEAQQWGAQGTPTFFFNGQKIVGARPIEFFRQAVDALLAGNPIPQPQRPIYRPKKNAYQPPPAIVPNIQIGNAPTLGEDNAQHTIVVFSEFQCPFCYRAVATIAQLLDKYPQSVRIVFKHFPLSFHRDAHLAAQAAMAAHAQGKFWEYHDKLFANMRALKRDDLIRYATAVGLDLPRFTKELDNGTYKAAVDADIAQGNQLGVRGTPTFFVNNQRLVGAQPLPRFQELIDKK